MFKFLEEFAKSVVAILLLVGLWLILAFVVMLFVLNAPTWVLVIIAVSCAVLFMYEAKS